jgi:hypothetical protein
MWLLAEEGLSQSYEGDQDAFGGTEVPPKPAPRMAVGGARGGGNQPAPAPAPAPVPARPRTAYPRPVSSPVTVLIYAGGKDDEPFGFGMDMDGLLGEVTGQLQ